MHKITFLLLAIGGINWLIFGLTGWDIGMLFGEMNNTVAKIIYVLVGLSALYEIFTHKKDCKSCAGKGGGAPAAPMGGGAPGA